MTQEDKNLLLKDLCARLPYGVKVKIPSIESPLTVLSINTNGVTWVTRDTGYPFEIDWENCKPYLLPLSSMTEEQKNDCPIGETNLNIIKSNIGYAYY